MVPHPKTPILNWFYQLLWFYTLSASEFSCLAKSYSVSGLTPLLNIFLFALCIPTLPLGC